MPPGLYGPGKRLCRKLFQHISADSVIAFPAPPLPGEEEQHYGTRVVLIQKWRALAAKSGDAYFVSRATGHAVVVPNYIWVRRLAMRGGSGMNVHPWVRNSWLIELRKNPKCILPVGVWSGLVSSRGLGIVSAEPPYVPVTRRFLTLFKLVA